MKLSSFTPALFTKFLIKRNLGKGLRTSRASRHGFSLVESVLALAIVGFASTVMLGLLPVGMSAFHSSVTETIESQIIHSLTTQASQANFSTLSNLATNFYYDDEGQPVATASNAVYTAVVSQVSPTVGGVSQSSNLSTIQVVIYSTRGTTTLNPADPTKLTYVIRVANFGQ